MSIDFSAINASVSSQFRGATLDYTKIESWGLPKIDELRTALRPKSVSTPLSTGIPLTPAQSWRKNFGLPYAGQQPRIIFLRVQERGHQIDDLSEWHIHDAKQPHHTTIALLSICAIRFNILKELNPALRATLYVVPWHDANGTPPKNQTYQSYTDQRFHGLMQPQHRAIAPLMNGNKLVRS